MCSANWQRTATSFSGGSREYRTRLVSSSSNNVRVDLVQTRREQRRGQHDAHPRSTTLSRQWLTHCDDRARRANASTGDRRRSIARDATFVESVVVLLSVRRASRVGRWRLGALERRRAARRTALRARRLGSSAFDLVRTPTVDRGNHRQRHCPFVVLPFVCPTRSSVSVQIDNQLLTSAKPRSVSIDGSPAIRSEIRWQTKLCRDE
jgi:hypothetical protein